MWQTPRAHDTPLLDKIVDTHIRDLLACYLGWVADLHGEIHFHTSTVDTRVFCGEDLLCRVVPYNELFHVQVGATPVWETRVRNESTCLDTMDRTLQRFLEIHAKRPG